MGEEPTRTSLPSTERPLPEIRTVCVGRPLLDDVSYSFEAGPIPCSASQDINMVMDAVSKLSEGLAKLEHAVKEMQSHSHPVFESGSHLERKKVDVNFSDAVSGSASSPGRAITKDELNMFTFLLNPLLDDRLQEVYTRLGKLECGSRAEGQSFDAQKVQVAINAGAQLNGHRNSKSSESSSGTHIWKTLDENRLKSYAGSVRVSEWEKTLDNEHEDFVLRPSVWDCSVFIFSGSSGPGTHAHLCLLLLLNMAIQLIFCVISAQNFSIPSINSGIVEEADRFRSDIAHDKKYANSVSGESLASRVCRKSGILEIAVGQVSLLSSIDSYLGIDDSLNDYWSQIFSGRMMFLLALACWGMSIIREVDNIFVGFRALVALRSTQGTLVSPITNGNAVLVSISFARVTFICLIYCIRIAICGFLIWAGALFLVTGIDVGELLLNAVALDFILSVDELIFEALAPSAASLFMSSLEPLSRPRWKQCFGFEIKAFIYFALLLVYVGAFSAVILVPMVKDMHSVKEKLCGGNRNFVISTDVLGMSYLEDSRAGDTEADSPQRNAVRVGISMQSISWDPFPSHARQWAMPILENATRTRAVSQSGVLYRSFPTLTRRELADGLKFWCSDGIAGQYATYLWSLINSHLSKYDLPLVSTNTSKAEDAARVCAELVEFCTLPQGNDLGNFVRLMCSRTCECANPLSLTFSHKPEYGCTSNCIKNLFYIADLNELPCEDHPSLEKSAQWLSWRHAVSNGNSLKRVDRTGCKELARRTSNQPNLSSELVDLCWGTTAVRPLAPLCPVACGCKDTNLMLQSRLMRENCPSACGIFNAR